ncbi:staphylococcal nuclease [Clavulina sp. PMI_390]|nr:staphylococcal nuclease [Clavulina sp. PMI_390]
MSLGSESDDSNWTKTEVWVPYLATAALASTATFGGLVAYKRFLKRFPDSKHIPAPLIARKGWIKGVVTSVGDADNFRIYHTPGPLFLWKAPFRRIPTSTKELRNQTIHIRIAGADAPEAAHFGKPKQPYADEALVWLKSQVAGKRVHCQLVHQDQYGRTVANVHLPPHLLPSSLFTGRNVGYEMVKAGWATTYTQSGAAYGSFGKDGFLVAEAKAKASRKGMWVNGEVETPAEYKKRHRIGEDSSSASDPSATESVSWWKRLLPWRSR